VTELDRFLQAGDVSETLRNHFLVVAGDEDERHAVPLQIAANVE